MFFSHVHHLDKGSFSILSAIAAILVAYGSLMVPQIKKSIGYKIAIPTTQERNNKFKQPKTQTTESPNRYFFFFLSELFFQ